MTLVGTPRSKVHGLGGGRRNAVWTAATRVRLKGVLGV